MLRVQFTNFRCFADTGPIELRPITLLVGENSAGKTSFLAGVRQVLESLNRDVPNLFNRDPYFLGGFEQILHRPSRSKGASSSFTMSIEASFRTGTSNGHRRPHEAVRHDFTYRHGSPQPELARYHTTYHGVSLELDLTGDQVVPVLQMAPEGKPTKLPTRRFPMERAATLRSHPGLLMNFVDFLLMDLGHPELLREAGHKSEPTTDGTKEASAVLRASRNMRATFRRPVFASAPVRTEPRRTYTPSEVAPSSEGSHVPLELARAKLRSEEQWRTIRGGLKDFGRISGLFSDIDVHRFGKKEIDPFQVMVKVNGPAMNLVDVGYGVSQILPIVYQLADPDAYVAYLLQQPEVHLHPRAKAGRGSLIVQTVAGAKQPPYILIETHSDYLVDRIRIEVANGRLLPDSVSVLFFRNQAYGATISTMDLDARGELINPPDDFRAFFLEEHGRLLGL